MRVGWLPVLVCAVSVLAAPAAEAQRTDVVTLANGDRITGQIMRLERGQLELKTDDAGTIQFEWTKLTRLEASRTFEINTVAGERLLGRLTPAPERSLAVLEFEGTEFEGIRLVTMAEVTGILPIGASFWRRIDGSLDVGYSYTRSSGIGQLNVNSTTTHHRPASEVRAAVSATLTQSQESGRDDRGSAEASYLRYPWRRWLWGAAARFESNESLGMRLRSQLGGIVGPRLVNSNRAQVMAGGGLVVNDERAVDADPTQNVEALGVFQSEYFTYDRPRTTLTFRLQYYASLSNVGRQRLQVDASAKRELWKDFFLSANLYDTFDSRPPGANANANDIGLSFSIGWTY